MSVLCGRLQAFFDGELDPTEAENFRHHLSGCAACEAGLRDLLQLELLAESASAAPDLPLDARTRWPGRRARWALAAVARAAGVLTLLLLCSGPARDTPPEVSFTRDEHRQIEARLTWSPADQYRRYEPPLGEASAAQPLPFSELAALQDERKLHAIAAISLTYGYPQQAAAYLAEVPDSADRQSDLAAVDLAGNTPESLEAALRATESALLLAPRHPQARWNRALALRQMGLEQLAAEAFEQVAALREPGWSKEARQRADSLRKSLSDRRTAWELAHAASLDIIDHPGAVLPLEQIHRFPGLFRATLYEAVLSATTADRVKALLPLARTLDALQGGEALQIWLHRVAAGDFRRRAPLAQGYARLASDKHPGHDQSQEVAGFLAQLRRSGEDDLFLGATLLAGKGGEHFPKLEKIAKARGDPWLRLRVELERTDHEWLQADQWWKTEGGLLAALTTCRTNRFSSLCVEIELKLAYVYIELHRPATAREYATRARDRARELGEWPLEQTALAWLAQTARLQRNLAQARAWLEELLLRDPTCPGQASHRQSLAEIYYLDFRWEDARRELERAQECQEPLDFRGATILAQLARIRFEPGDGKLIRQAIDTRLIADSRKGVRVYAEYILGRFELERDRASGRALLRRTIQDAEQLPPADEVNGRKARTFSYASLIMDAGRSGEIQQAVALLAEELGTIAPERCVLAVAVDQERTLLAVRGTSGEVIGHSEEHRTAPLGDVSGLVPQGLLEALRPCERVDVLASPSVQGRAGLLPAELAWSYRVGRPGDGTPPRLAPRELVVSGVDAPPGLRLPSIPLWPSAREPAVSRLELTGPSATPTAVLDAMEDSTEIEIQAHGLANPTLFDASFLVLSPEGDGRYALTAGDLRKRHLRGAPTVFLVACGTAKAAPFLHESFSLPNAFIQAGAKAVFAAAVDIPPPASQFFAAIRERIRGGATPASALRDERQAWLQTRPADSWVQQILLFE